MSMSRLQVRMRPEAMKGSTECRAFCYAILLMVQGDGSIWGLQSAQALGAAVSASASFKQQLEAYQQKEGDLTRQARL